MKVRFDFKWLAMGVALSVILTLAVRALTGIWFVGFFLFLPLGLSFGAKSWGRSGDAGAPAQSPPAEAYSSTPYTQDELRQRELPDSMNRVS